MFEVLIHWLEFTVSKETAASETIGEVKRCLESDFKDAGHGSYGYETMMIGLAGAKILTSAKRPEHHAVLPGEWCEAVGVERCKELVAWVFVRGGHFTRLDLAGDDHAKIARAADVAAAVERGELVTRCQNVRRVHSLRGKPADMVYVGTRGSRRMARVYNKDWESEGKMDAIRWELELRDEAADRAGKLAILHGLQEEYASQLVSVADFKDVTSDGNSARRPRTAWFEKLVGDAKKASLGLPQPVRTVEEMESWLRRQGAPTMATLVKAKGGDLGIIEELLEDGGKRLGPAHRMAIEAAQRRKPTRVDDEGPLGE